MNTGGWVGAVGGGVAGALIWAMVAHFTGFEVGYVAWAVGGLVGMGCRLLGGSGTAAGLSCAGIALLSILAGKAIAVSWLIGDGISHELYGKLSQDSVAFAEVRSRSDTKEFMVAHEYTGALGPEWVSSQEVEEFDQMWAPQLRELHERQPTYEEWAESPSGSLCLQQIGAEDASVTTVVFAGLSLIDLVFALLGVATAYKVAVGAEANS